MRARRERREHPLLFVLTLGTFCAAIVNGDVGVAILMMVVLVASLL